MAYTLENPYRKKFWFGTQHHAGWVNVPNRGADMTPLAWGAEGTFLTGGGFSRNSADSHRQYIFEWSGASSRQEAETMQAYRDGVYSKSPRDLIYFIDPLTYSRNVLPKRWAQPGIVTVEGKTVPSPLGLAQSAQSPGVLGEPFVGARVSSLTLNEFEALTRPGRGSVWVPIPEGETLTVVAWTGDVNGDNGLYARSIGGPTQKLGLMPREFSGVPGILLGTVGTFDFFGARAVIGEGDDWRDPVQYSWDDAENNSVSYRSTANGSITNEYETPMTPVVGPDTLSGYSTPFTVVARAQNYGQVLTVGNDVAVAVRDGDVIRAKGSDPIDLGAGVWQDLTIVAGDYNGPPFTGDTEWEGPMWMPGSGHSGCRFVGNPTWAANSGVGGGQIGYAATLKEVGDWL